MKKSEDTAMIAASTPQRHHLHLGAPVVRRVAVDGVAVDVQPPGYVGGA